MVDALTSTELLSIRSKAWGTLENRYPDDPTLGLIRSIDLQLAAMGSPMKPKTGGGTETPTDSSELIATAAEKLFREAIREPQYGRQIVAALRKANVPLPEGDRGATATITAVFARRPKIFKRFPGKSEKATSRWHLQVA